MRRHSTPHQLALRGRIILAAAEGKNNRQIARELGRCVETVRQVRRRWIGLHAGSLQALPVRERLEDVPRPGRPSQISAEPTCPMIALACEQPKERPLSQWTGREIAEEVMRRGLVAQISPRQASRLLTKGTSSPISSAIG